MAQRAVTIAVIALVAVLWGAAPARAAAPRLVMVSGAPLAAPVLLSDWDEIATLYGMLVSGPATPSELRGRRPSLQLALFWDANLWEPYVRDGRLGSLRSGQANQFGWFYPAVPGSPALVELPRVGTWPRRVSPQALAILARHGVPVRLLDGSARTGMPAGGGVRWWWSGGIGVALGIGGVVLLVRRKLPVIERWKRPRA
jgi:hypothetical protein